LIPLAILLLILSGGWLYAALFWTFVIVPTGSMSNTILPGDRLIASRVAQEIKRGNLVIFKFPADPSTRYVSRIIGLPGETVEFDSARSTVIINGEPLPERRIFVKTPEDAPRYPGGTLVPKVEEPEPAGSQWSVYYDERYKTEPRFEQGMTYAVKHPFKIPVKGDPIPAEIKSDPRLNQVYDHDNDGKFDSDQYFCMGDNRDNSLDGRFWGTVPKEFIIGRPFMVYSSVEKDKHGNERTRWDRIFTRLK